MTTRLLIALIVRRRYEARATDVVAENPLDGNAKIGARTQQGGSDVADAHARSWGPRCEERRTTMSPDEIARTVLLALSFGLAIVVLAVLTLILEAIVFVIGLGRRDVEWRG
jgi:hypothetical protein